MSKSDDYAAMGLRALRRAAAKVHEDTRRNNYPIPVWKDGQVVYITPPPPPPEWLTIREEHAGDTGDAD
jgi:hypothetical protein